MHDFESPTPNNDQRPQAEQTEQPESFTLLSLVASVHQLREMCPEGDLRNFLATFDEIDTTKLRTGSPEAAREIGKILEFNQNFHTLTRGIEQWRPQDGGVTGKDLGFTSQDQLAPVMRLIESVNRATTHYIKEAVEKLFNKDWQPIARAVPSLEAARGFHAAKLYSPYPENAPTYGMRVDFTDDTPPLEKNIDAIEYLIFKTPPTARFESADFNPEENRFTVRIDPKTEEGEGSES